MRTLTPNLQPKGVRIGFNMSEQLNLRSEQIIKFLLRVGAATIEEILAVAGSSAPSIRRDLARLENRGLIRRTAARRWSSHSSMSHFATTVPSWRGSSATLSKSAGLVWPPRN